MSSKAPDQSPLVIAKAELNELDQKFHVELDRLRTAPINECEKHIDSLKKSFRLSQDSAVFKLEKALEVSDLCIHTLENSLRAERERATSLQQECSANAREARLKYTELQSKLGCVKDELEAAKLRPTDLQNDLDRVKQQNSDLQEKYAAAEHGRKDLSTELAAVRRHETDLQAELETVRKRASSMESEISTLRSDFNRAESLNEEPDRSFYKKLLQELKDPKHQEHNKFFLHSSDSQLIGLNVMETKLQKGVYTSAHSFQTDFNLMINKCKIDNAPGSKLHAASEKLQGIFCETWSALRPVSRHGISQDHAAGGSNNRGHKRKASTECPCPSEGNATPSRAPDPSNLSSSSSQPAGLAASQNFNADLPQSTQTHADSAWRPETGLSAWVGKVGTTFSLDINKGVEHRAVEFRVTATDVSLIKSPSTFQAPWTELLPAKLCVESRRMPSTTEDQLRYFDFDPLSDMVILHLGPSSEAEQVDFAHLCNDLVYKGRYAKVRHGNDTYVRSYHLIPALAWGSSTPIYPACLSGLDCERLSPLMTRNALFLVIVFRIGLPEQRLVRMAWDRLFQAVHAAGDVKAIIDARDRISHHWLIVHRGSQLRMSFDKDYMALLQGLPLARSGSTPTSGSDCLLNLTSDVDSSDWSAKAGVTKFPSRVFVLGGMEQLPRSWNKWQSIVDEDDTYNKAYPSRVKIPGLKIERCSQAD
ncbi:hypothetical protein diail_9683 [Diaporthe ilicicola]|nr:hypothetical protein diail_9683 [Diaporthe ilicicola]